MVKKAFNPFSLKTSSKTDSYLETDLLIIGGSGAAAYAAISAATTGINIIVASKGKVGRSGNSIITTANISMDGESAYKYGERKADRFFTAEKLYNKILKYSFYLSKPELARQFAEDCGELVRDFIETGKKLGKRFIFLPPSGWITTGDTVGAIIRDKIKTLKEITLLEDTIITDLLKSGNRVSGAIGVSVLSGEIVCIKARAIIIAAGGYQPYSFKCTTADSTGDGLAMAMRAGAKLADMEFMLYLPGVMLSPAWHRGSILPFLWYAGGFVKPKITSATGMDIMKEIPSNIKELSENSKWMKLIHTYYWAQNIDKPETGVIFDFNSINKIRYTLSRAKANMMLKILYGNKWKYQGEIFKDIFKDIFKNNKDQWKVGISSEYSMGGVLIDSTMASTVEGLFACGEAASGTFGAFRGENGLTEMIVQGYRAGEFAASFIKDSGDTEINREDVNEKIETILKPFSVSITGESEQSQVYLKESFKASSKGSYFDIEEKLEKAADSGFGYIRNEENILSSLKTVREIRRNLLNIISLKGQTRNYNSQWLKFLSLRNTALCLEASLMAANMRKESRGMHIRSDYPEVNHEKWLFRITSELTDNTQSGEILLSKQRPGNATNWPLLIERLNRKNKNIIDYISLAEKDWYWKKINIQER